VTIRFEVNPRVQRRIDAGEECDVAILNPPVLDNLIRQRKVLAGTRVVIGRSGIGVGARQGAPPPDISSVAAFTRTLLAARSVAYPGEGASGTYFVSLVDRLGIAAEMKPRMRPMPAEYNVEVVADGEAELLVGGTRTRGSGHRAVHGVISAPHAGMGHDVPLDCDPWPRALAESMQSDSQLCTNGAWGTEMRAAKRVSEVQRICSIREIQEADSHRRVGPTSAVQSLRDRHVKYRPWTDAAAFDVNELGTGALHQVREIVLFNLEWRAASVPRRQGGRKTAVDALVRDARSTHMTLVMIGCEACARVDFKDVLFQKESTVDGADLLHIGERVADV
jgi:hypothetical protein